MLTSRRLIVTFGVAALLVIMLVPGAATAATGPSPGVFPPHSKPFGHSYGEWSARWWQQTLALHGSQHPNAFDSGEVPCNLGTREVAFLVGTTGGTVRRACTIRQGQAVLFPLINGECSEIEGAGSTEAELRACAVAQANAFARLRATVDGRELEGLLPLQVRVAAVPLPKRERQPLRRAGDPAGRPQYRGRRRLLGHAPPAWAGACIGSGSAARRRLRLQDQGHIQPPRRVVQSCGDRSHKLGCRRPDLPLACACLVRRR